MRYAVSAEIRASGLQRFGTLEPATIRICGDRSAEEDTSLRGTSGPRFGTERGTMRFRPKDDGKKRNRATQRVEF
jgi:hypothetical protein